MVSPRALAPLALTCLAGGCTLVRALDELDRFERTCRIEGRVLANGGGGRSSPIVVPLLRQEPDGTYDSATPWFRHGAGPFEFLFDPGE